MMKESGGGLTGIEQLRAFILSGKRAGMAVSLAFQLVEVGDGFAAFEGIPGLHAYNPMEPFAVAMPRRFWTPPAVVQSIPISRRVIATQRSN